MLRNILIICRYLCTVVNEDILRVDDVEQGEDLRPVVLSGKYGVRLEQLHAALLLQPPSVGILA